MERSQILHAFASSTYFRKHDVMKFTDMRSRKRRNVSYVIKNEIPSVESPSSNTLPSTIILMFLVLESCYYSAGSV